MYRRSLSSSFSSRDHINNYFLVSNTGENTVEHHRRVLAKQWVKPQPLSEKPRIEDAGDSADALVAGVVVETEVAEDEEALVVVVVVAVVVAVEALEEVALHNSDPLDRPRASMDRDEANNSVERKKQSEFSAARNYCNAAWDSLPLHRSVHTTYRQKHLVCGFFESHFHYLHWLSTRTLFAFHDQWHAKWI